MRATYINMLLDKFTIVANSCVGYQVFSAISGKHITEIEYTNPFIASLFLSDRDFVKLSSSYDKYLSNTPVLEEPYADNPWYRQTGCSRLTCPTQFPINYATMHLGDIEVHWIHKAFVDAPKMLDKFKKRHLKSIGLQRIFVWSAAEIFNTHSEYCREFLLDTYLSSPDRSVFLTNRRSEVFEDDLHTSVFISEWENCNEEERRVDGVLAWGDQAFIARRLKEEIEFKFKEGQ